MPCSLYNGGDPGFQKTRLVVSFSIGNPQSVACSLRTKEADTRRGVYPAEVRISSRSEERRVGKECRL